MIVKCSRIWNTKFLSILVGFNTFVYKFCSIFEFFFLDQHSYTAMTSKKRAGSKSPQLPHYSGKKHRFDRDGELGEDIRKKRESLPIFPVKGKLLAEICKNRSSIVIGETASGKTTQIPQYLFEGGFCKQGCIAITQPRRVS